MDEQKPRDRSDTHDRILRIEIEHEQWKSSVERRLDECATTTKWLTGLIGVALVGLVVRLLTLGL